MTKSSPYTVKSVEDFLANLPPPKSGFNLIYRGHERVSYKLIPSLYRGSEYPRERDEYIKIIEEALSSFENRGVISEGWQSLDDFGKSAIAQHYGIPTPILDWTVDPKVALFFACSEISTNEDGEVIVLYGKPKAGCGESYDIDCAFPYLNIPESCERHACQKGLFTYNPFFNGKEPVAIDEIVIFGEPIYPGFHYRIPHGLRRTLQKELEVLGIDYRTIYPDAEGVAKYASWKISTYNG